MVKVGIIWGEMIDLGKEITGLGLRDVCLRDDHGGFVGGQNRDWGSIICPHGIGYSTHEP